MERRLQPALRAGGPQRHAAERSRRPARNALASTISRVPEPGSLDGIILQVWVTPRSSQERLTRLKDGRIKAYVSAPAESGRANARLVTLLADRLGVPHDAVQIVAGTSHPKKLVRVAGRTEAEIEERIRPLPSGQPLKPGGRRWRDRHGLVRRRRRRAARSG